MIGGSTVHSILCRLVDTWRDPNIFEDLKKRLIAFKSHVRVICSSKYFRSSPLNVL